MHVLENYVLPAHHTAHIHYSVGNGQARLKSNGKFQCKCAAGSKRKARRLDTLPQEKAEQFQSKYFVGDRDAAHEQALEVRQIAELKEALEASEAAKYQVERSLRVRSSCGRRT